MSHKLRIIYFVVFFLFGYAQAENIDPNEDGSQYAYGENVGWFNAEPNTGDGIQVASDKLTGYIWAENIGWINLDPNDADPNTGIANDGAGNLSGCAWGENVGWINFDPNVPDDQNDYGVMIDADGAFDGYAWAENIGWINFGITNNRVVACKITFEDLANFVNYWLGSGVNPANLDGETDRVDLEDYGIFSGFWQDFCPDGWQLK